MFPKNYDHPFFTKSIGMCVMPMTDPSGILKGGARAAVDRAAGFT